MIYRWPMGRTYVAIFRSAGVGGRLLTLFQVRRGFLDYDLEALHEFAQLRQTEHIFVAFEDSEGFDSALLSDLIPLLK